MPHLAHATEPGRGVNARVMKDPRIAGMNGQKMPFDPKRMSYGGFEVMVDL